MVDGPLKVTVPKVPGVKVPPLLVQFPLTVNVFAPVINASAAPELIVILLATFGMPSFFILATNVPAIITSVVDFGTQPQAQLVGSSQSSVPIPVHVPGTQEPA